MILHKDAVWGEKAKERRQKLQFLIRHGKGLPDCIMVCLCKEDSKNLLELIDTAELKRLHWREPDTVIVGIADNKGEAMEICRQIIDRVYQETGALEVRRFYLNKKD